jgi:hypothetical protein
MQHPQELLYWLQGRLLLAAVAVFVILLVVVYWPRNTSRIEWHARIPLGDDR